MGLEQGLSYISQCTGINPYHVIQVFGSVAGTLGGVNNSLR